MRKFAVLGSLPESFDTFLMSLNARKADELDWDNVKGLLIKEYMKRKEKNERQELDDALFVKKGNNFDNCKRKPQSRGAARGVSLLCPHSQVSIQKAVKNDNCDRLKGI